VIAATALVRLLDKLTSNDGRHEAESRPEPVLNEAKIGADVAALVTALGTAAVALGVVSGTDASVLTAALIAIGGGVVTVVNYIVTQRAANRARRLVTPTSDPRGADGQALVPAL